MPHAACVSARVARGSVDVADGMRWWRFVVMRSRRACVCVCDERSELGG